MAFLYKPPIYEFDLDVPLDAILKEIGYIKNANDYVKQIFGINIAGSNAYLELFATNPYPSIRSSIIGYFDSSTFYHYGITSFCNFSGINQFTGAHITGIFQGGIMYAEGCFIATIINPDELISRLTMGVKDNDEIHLAYEKYAGMTGGRKYLKVREGNIGYGIFKIEPATGLLELNYQAPDLFSSIKVIIPPDYINFWDYTNTNAVSRLNSNGEYENLTNGNGIILRDAGGTTYPAGTRWRLKVVDGVLTLEQLL